MSVKLNVGTPSNGFNGWSTTEVNFHGFANLSTTRDECVQSPEFLCFGHQWKLCLYPGGHIASPEGYAVLVLFNKSNTGIEVQFGYSVRNADGRELVHHMPQTHEFGAHDSEDDDAYYKINFAPRYILMDLLVDGSLIIELRMKSTSTDKIITQFIPTNPINKNVLELFNDEETADVVFGVGGEQQAKGKRKRANPSTTNFYAHRIILKKCTPTLYEMCRVSG